MGVLLGAAGAEQRPLPAACLGRGATACPLSVPNAQGSVPPVLRAGEAPGPGPGSGPGLGRGAVAMETGPPRPAPRARHAPEAATVSGVTGGAMAADTQVSAGRSRPGDGGGGGVPPGAASRSRYRCAPSSCLRGLALRPRPDGDVAAVPGAGRPRRRRCPLEPPAGRPHRRRAPTGGAREGTPRCRSLSISEVAGKPGLSRRSVSGCRGPERSAGRRLPRWDGSRPLPKSVPDKRLAQAASLPAESRLRLPAQRRARRARGLPPPCSQRLSGGCGSREPRLERESPSLVPAPGG